MVSFDVAARNRGTPRRGGGGGSVISEYALYSLCIGTATIILSVGRATADAAQTEDRGRSDAFLVYWVPQRWHPRRVGHVGRCRHPVSLTAGRGGSVGPVIESRCMHVQYNKRRVEGGGSVKLCTPSGRRLYVSVWEAGCLFASWWWPPSCCDAAQVEGFASRSYMPFPPSWGSN